jgi:hypothetical protein
MWSLTVYSFDTHALICDVPRASRSSLVQGLQTNSDGTTDIYFGPSAPQGKDSNWLPTKPASALKLSSASTVQRSQSSTNPGRCLTSRKPSKGDSIPIIDQQLEEKNRDA